ncbi:efflux RND transporter periplasmic adaptor subunit [Corallococcus sp. BB11-1]|uniref:efflux RND transporter periplasmic adaptor subunit n=1 Tax=Corallococcus sp. BB11-1 TaxID=2996783 RepID=UPI00226DEB2B|nr:efflux RND transporter periplasmic adaptor subunit [Corallococcus sp. BB11-1]MCY1037002.1 efflux RND transporter periplasmic adaptor subunit [Corallococcus sp. BB11-1]
MKSPLLLLTVLVVGLASCKANKPGHDDAHEEGHDPAAPSKSHDEPEDEVHVHIPQEMLRDLRVTTAKVEARPGGESVTVLGELTFSEDAYAEVSTPVPARVAAVVVTTGQAVKQGQRLADLQSPALGRARAELQAAQARATAARQAADRKRLLADERIVARKDVQAAEAEAAASEAEVAAAKASLTSLGASGASSDGAPNFVLKAPIDGTVIERAARLGQMADPSQPLFRIGDLSSLWLIAHAFERDAVRLKPGTEARVTFAAFPGQEFPAKVGHVGQQVDPSSRTIPVRLELDNSKGLLRPGMSATASVPLGDSNATLTAVPAAALQRLENGWVAFIPMKEPGVFEQREVGRGRSVGALVEVLSGLSVGEQVVVDGAFLLKAEVEKSRGGGDDHGH